MSQNDFKAKEYAHKISDISKTLEQLVWEMIHELQASEQHYRSIVEFAGDAIITINPQRVVTSWNQGAAKIFGFNETEAIGVEIDNLIAREKAANEALKLSRQVLGGHPIHSYEAIRYTRDGLPRNVLISASPIFNDEGQVEAVSLMYKDITELKQAHEQLVRTEKQATLGVIAGSIGHELNNLVGGLLLHTRLLQKFHDRPEKVKEIAEIFATNLEKVALHGKNLLSLSRPTRPRFEPLDLNAVLQETTETLNQTGVLKHFRVEQSLFSGNAIVYGDRNLLEQMIRNLEINSAHAMEYGGILRLTIRLTEDGKYYEVLFEDSGSGVPDEILDKIFMPFFTTKSEGQGTGLGLPIVKEIVDQHKGYINLASTTGQGTIVTIGIPVATDVVFTKNITL